VTEYPILPKAPITEALIDIRIKVKEDFKVEQLLPLYDLISIQYPEKKSRHKWEGKLEFKKDELPIPSGIHAIDGYSFTSIDKKQIFQARVDGFTFNKLKPYDRWETFRDEALRLWKLYRDVTSPEIIRVALRFINKFDIPLPIQDFNEYLTAAPIVPEGLPQGVNSFLTRIVIHEPEIDAAAIVTQVFEQIVNPSYLPIILDIDVFKQKSKGIAEEEAWQTLEKFRHFKNKIFFKSITEKAKELFQ
jgi:uncharacterized protein (TIGR04255 family)